MRFFFLGLLVTFVLVSGCGSSRSATVTSMPGHWQSTSIRADGNDLDWKKPFLYQDSKEECVYSITNDSSNLYFCLKTADDALQMKILHDGVTLWLNNNGQKKETMAIRFPLKDSSHNATSDIMPGQRPDMARMKRTALARVGAYSLSGFGPGYDGAFSLEKNTAPGFALSISFNPDRELVYEAVIPLAALYGTTAGLFDKPGNFAIGFVSIGLPMPSMPSGMEGPPGEGMQGPPGSGFGGEEGMRQMQKMFSDTKIWKVQPLATKPF